MRKRGSGESSLVISFIGGVYKCLAVSSELMARVKNESRNVVVYEKGIMKETGV